METNNSNNNDNDNDNDNNNCILNTELPLLTGCEIEGFFQDFPGPFQANLRTFCTK